MNKEDILITIREYEKSDFENTSARNRYFTIDESDYILPTKFIIRKTMQRLGISENLTTDISETLLKKFFSSYHSIDIQVQNAVLPLYQEIAMKVLEYRDYHQGLIDIIKDMQNQGINTISLNDTSDTGTVELTDIDPFTFYSNFNRKIKPVNRAKILK